MKKLTALFAMTFLLFAAHGQIAETEIQDKCNEKTLINDSLAHGRGIAIDASLSKAKYMAFYDALIDLTNSMPIYGKVIDNNIGLSSIGANLFENSVPFDRCISKLFKTVAFDILTETEDVSFVNTSWIDFIGSHADIICESVVKESDGRSKVTCLVEIKDYSKQWLLLAYYASLYGESEFQKVEMNEKEIEKHFNNNQK